MNCFRSLGNDLSEMLITTISKYKIKCVLNSLLSLSRSPRDSLKYFEITVTRHIRFVEFRRKKNGTTTFSYFSTKTYVMGNYQNLKLNHSLVVSECGWKLRTCLCSGTLGEAKFCLKHLRYDLVEV